jgi:hypothetical protein
LGISATTIKYGIPITLAQPIPNPDMATNSKYLLAIYGKANKNLKQLIRNKSHEHFKTVFFSKFIKVKAIKKVTILY